MKKQKKPAAAKQRKVKPTAQVIETEREPQAYTPAVKKQSKFKKIFGFAGRPLRWLWRRKWWVIVAAAVLLGGYYWLFAGKSDQAANQFVTVPVMRGNLRQVVTATGEIRPVNTISVGSQVSGIISHIYVDYNDRVTKGQVLLTIDPSVLQSTVDDARAALDSAKSQLSFDQSEYKRSQTLFNSGYIARSEMEQARTKFETSQQSVKRAQSQYDRAMVNLGYATITSPVDGTVIARKVDLGQTVAASFQAPDLFSIAEDLTKMQIQTNVSEADIGMVKEGQSVTFTVDAYPTQTFKGAVQQIRLSPTTTQNVVVYTVIIDVDNSDLRLMPGMTAFVTIAVAERADVWKAQNAAFLVRDLKSLSDDPCIQDGTCTPRNTLLVQGPDKNATVRLVPFKKGLVTATETEIIATDDAKPVSAGDKIITGKTGAAPKTATVTPFGGGGGGNRGPGGGGMRIGG
ncbi:MAG: efflux RND transporter periplasmic adaptor subunit [Proteobacteria bacterium]|nr:efflux RND transporter periplasmic adaptor subunit [Pseudomonadota bacterium]